MTTPFFYIIQHNDSKRYYAGSKFGKDSDPSTFMTEDGYKTSSNTIHKLIIENGLDSFSIRKLKIFDTPNEAYEYETRFLKKVKARSNNKFINGHENDGVLPSYGSDKYKEFMIAKYGVEFPAYSKDLMKKAGEAISKTKNDPTWKDENEPRRVQKFLSSMDYEVSKRKEMETKSDPMWIEEVWKPAIEKRTRKLIESGKSKEVGRKCSQTKLSEKWKKEVGDIANAKHSETINSDEWQNTTGVTWKKKMKQTRNDPEWKRKNTFTCEYCGKQSDSGNYKRWHGSNCKHKN